MEKFFKLLGKILYWMFSPILWIFKKIQNSKLGILPYIAVAFLLGSYFIYKGISSLWRNYGWWNVVVLAVIAAIVLIAWGLKSGKIKFAASSSTPPGTVPADQPNRWSRWWTRAVDTFEDWSWKLALTLIIILCAIIMWHWVDSWYRPSSEPVTAEYHNVYETLHSGTYEFEANHTYHYNISLDSAYDFKSDAFAHFVIKYQADSTRQFLKGTIDTSGLKITDRPIPLNHSGDYVFRCDSARVIHVSVSKATPKS